MKNYYTILELASNASESEIRDAYRRLAKSYHPDVNKSANAHIKFIEITEAYEFLMKHANKYREEYKRAYNYEQEKRDFKASEKYEQFRREAHERAQQQAKMRYEEFEKQNEAFQKSGLNDIVLLLKIFLRIALLPLFLLLFLLPFYIAFIDSWKMIFLLLVFWPLAGIIAWYVHDNRKNYFITGNLYYTPSQIRKIFTETNLTEQKCYYSPSKMANSRAYKMELLKLKDVRVKSDGFRQHTANYINDKATTMVPRSRKAFMVHSMNVIIKMITILGCLFFLDISSIVWRFIIGFALAGIISSIFLLFARTKSNTSYLISFGLIFRVIVWLFVITMVSYFRTEPFDIVTSGFIRFVVAAIIIFDCFLMQLVNITFGKYAYMPIIKQYSDVNTKFNEGYKLYNDITVISVIFPLFKWIFG